MAGRAVTVYSAGIAAKLLDGMSKTQVARLRLVTSNPIERGPRPAYDVPAAATVFDSWRTAMVWAGVAGRRAHCQVRKVDGRWMAWRGPIPTPKKGAVR